MLLTPSNDSAVRALKVILKRDQTAGIDSTGITD
jgi:hypothetical protein